MSRIVFRLLLTLWLLFFELILTEIRGIDNHLIIKNWVFF
jgi:hypothetical protein